MAFDATVVGVLAVAASVAIAALFYIVLRRPTLPPTPAATAGADAAEAAGGARARPDRSGLARLNRRGRHADAADVAVGPAAAGGAVAVDEDVDEGADDVHGKKLGKKKLEKMQRKEEERRHREVGRLRRAAGACRLLHGTSRASCILRYRLFRSPSLQWLEAQREDARRREALKEEERRQKKDKDERAAKEAEEAEARRLEAIRQQEEAEYALLKQGIVVEEAGTDALDDEAVAALLDRMEVYIKDTKVVSLEELASEFEIRTQVRKALHCGATRPGAARSDDATPFRRPRCIAQDAIRHLKDLDAAGRITGVLDDRGKYICVSADELAKVAEFITSRGRVSRRYGGSGHLPRAVCMDDAHKGAMAFSGAVPWQRTGGGLQPADRFEPTADGGGGGEHGRRFRRGRRCAGRSHTASGGTIRRRSSLMKIRSL